MYQASATFVTDQSTRLLKRLCKHFSHKVDAEWEEQCGTLHFEIGVARLEAGVDELRLHCQASTQPQLLQLQDILARHLQGMAAVPDLVLDWQSR